MRHILGIVGSLAHNLETGGSTYMSQIDISEDILKWLEMHDCRLDDKGAKIYICNAIEYIYLGPKIEPVAMDFMNPGKENLA